MHGSVLEWASAMDLRNDNPCDRVLREIDGPTGLVESVRGSRL